MAALALAAALAVPAAPVQAAGLEAPGELDRAWEWLCRRVLAVLGSAPESGIEQHRIQTGYDSHSQSDESSAARERGSYIDPNG